MATFSNAWQTPSHSFALPSDGAVRSVASVNQSLRSVVQEMRAFRVSYEDAVSEFRRRYIIGVLVVHTFHRGRTAQELGMHRNTLARTLVELNIDVKQIRSALRARNSARPQQTNIFLARQS
jgi:DNA-binding NtrC family response regulator